MSGFKSKVLNYIIGFILAVITVIVIKRDIFAENTVDWNFKGEVTKVKYDVKGCPTVTVRGKKYYLFNVVLMYTINRGDTIIKNKGDLRIKIIRRNTKDTLYTDTNSEGNEIDWHFKNVVTNVVYEERGFVDIMLNGKEYTLDDVIWDISKKIRKGDTLIKSAGNMRIKILRPNTQDTIYLNGRSN